MKIEATHQKSKEYVRPMPITWWLRRRTYLLYMLRELTCIFVGGYAIFLLVLVGQADNKQAFSDLLESPVNMVFHLIALPMVLYHSITWFNLTPKVIVIRWGEERVSPTLIAASNYVAWLVISVLVAWIAFSWR